MIGRARSAFYAFATATLESLLALMATGSRLVGLAQLAVAVGVLATSTTFTVAAARSGHLNYWRAVPYHAGLFLVIVAAVARSIGGAAPPPPLTPSPRLVLLLPLSLSNSWELLPTPHPQQSGGARPGPGSPGAG